MRNLKRRAVLVCLLACSLILSGCNQEKWIKVAQANLPPTIQMATNLINLATLLKTGQQLGDEQVIALNKLGQEAKDGLHTLQDLIDVYKQSPSQTTLDKIRAAINSLNVNLPQLLNALHIKNAELTTRIAMAVGIIVHTVQIYASLLPGGGDTAQARSTQPPTPKALKDEWNRLVAGPSSDPVINAAFAGLQMK
jgi:hypothetical protein